MAISDYFLYKECLGSNRLIVIFSGRAARSFNLYKIIEDVPINKIFIRDPAGNNWYNSSLEVDEGGWEGIDGLIEKINSYVEKFDINNVYITGGSMGGYAALITAFKLNIKKCLIFSPQIFLDYRLPNNPSKDIYIKYKNAFDFYESAAGLSVKIVVGSDEIADVYNAGNCFKLPGIDVVSVKSSPHNVLHFLAKNNLLGFTIQSFLEDREFDIVLPSFNFFNSNFFVGLINKIVEGFYYEAYSFDEIKQALDLASERAPFWAALPYIKGKLYEKFDRKDEAIAFYEDALKLSPENSLFHLELGNLLIKENSFQRAESEFLNAINFSEAANAFLYFKLGVCYLLQKKYEDAFEAQKKAIEINSVFSPSYYQLGLIENIRKNYKNAVLLLEEALRLKDKNPNLIKHLETARRNIKNC